MRWILALAIVVVASTANAENELIADPARPIAPGTTERLGAVISPLQAPPAQPSLDQDRANLPAPSPSTPNRRCAQSSTAIRSP
jgi:hypothetical protein